MKTSRTRFVVTFLVCAFAFQFLSNLLLPPVNGEWFPGTESPTAWKRTLAAVLYPLKFVLAGPLPLVFNDPDPAPPVRALACAVYWSFIALVLYYLITSIPVRKKI